MRRTGIGENRAQHIAYHFFRRLLLRKLLSCPRIALLRRLHARVKVDACTIRPSAHGIFQYGVHIRALALQIMRHLVRGEIGVGPFLRIQRNFEHTTAVIPGVRSIPLLRTALRVRLRGVSWLRTSCARHFSPSGLRVRTALRVRLRGVSWLRTSCARHFSPSGLRCAAFYRDAIPRNKYHVVLPPQRLQHAQVRHLLPVQIFACAVLPY